VIATLKRGLYPVWGWLFTIVLTSVSHAQSTNCSPEAIAVKPISGVPVLSFGDAINNSVGSQLIITVAPGEYESASLVAHNKKGECPGVTLSVDDLQMSGASTQTISKDNLQIKFVKKWFQGGTAWTGIASNGTRKMTPELLLNDPLLVKVDTNQQHNYLRIIKNGQPTYIDISVDAKKTDRETPAIDEMDIRDAKTLQPIDLDQDAQQVWLTFHASEQASPGTYHSTLHISRNHTDLLTIPIMIEVLPFKLAPPALEYSIFYRGQLTDKTGTISSEYKNEAQYRADLIDMLAHGISNPNIYQSFDNLDLLQKALTIRQSVGFTQPTIYYLGKSASIANSVDKRRELSYYASTMKRLCAPLGYTDLYFFGADEAEGALQHQQLPSWQYARNTAGLKVFTTGYKGSFDNVGAQLDMLVLASEPDSQEIGKFHAVGKRVLTYAYPQSGPENPELFRRNFGINLWALGSDGAMTYAYQESFGLTWNDFDHKDYRDHNFVYATSDGVIDTIAWEGFREAVDDVRYLTTLKNLIEKVRPKCSAQACTDAVVEAAATFDAIKIKSSDRDLDSTRKQIIAQILRLQVFTNAGYPPSPPLMQSSQ